MKTETVQIQYTAKDLKAIDFYKSVREELPRDFVRHIEKLPNLKEWLQEGYRILKDQTKFDNWTIRQILEGAALTKTQNPHSIRNALPVWLKNAEKAKAGRIGGFNKGKNEKERAYRKRLEEISSRGGKGATSADKQFAQSVAHTSHIQKRAEESIGSEIFRHEVDEGPAAKSRAEFCILYIKDFVELNKRILEAAKLKDVALEIRGRNGFPVDEIRVVPLVRS